SILDHVKHKLGRVAPDIERTQVSRHPSPAFHVHDDALLDVGLVALSFDGIATFAAARPQESLVETDELLVLRMQGLQIGIRRPRGGDLHQHLLRIVQRRGLVEYGAEFTRVKASAASKARIFKYG